MGKPTRHRDDKYKKRLNELKEKLKPYRSKDTVPLLRVITGSSSRELHKHWESLESVLTGQYSHQIVKQRIQSVAELILKNGEFTSRVDSNTIDQGSVCQQFVHLQVDSEANEVDNVRHVNIVSDPNVVDSVRRVNIDSRSSMFAKDDVLGNETRHGNNSNANVTNRLGHLHIGGCNAECYRS